MDDVPTTVGFPEPLPAVRRARDAWTVPTDGVEVRLSNLDKLYWGPEGYTKADLVAYYWNIAPYALPYVAGRALTMKRMPDGADGAFFYAKQAPGHTPRWVRTAAVTSRDTGKTIDYILAGDRATLVWLANAGCIELHPWHSRVDAIGKPDYAFFDLDPFGTDFDTVLDVALHVRAALEHLGLRGYARTSGATGMQVYVPIDRVHSHAAVRAFVRRVCQHIHDADPDRTTIAHEIAERTGRVYLDYGMNTEGRNIAGTYSLRPERAAPVATPLEWEEVANGVVPQDFTIATIFERLERVGDLFTPVLEGGQTLTGAAAALGLDLAQFEQPSGHDVGDAPEPEPAADVAERLATYRAKRDFTRTPEPGHGERGADEPAPGPGFVLQHHLATRLHHDLRLEHDGVAVSWALPKGLPDVRGLRRLAVQTEDHPLEYMTFSGEIPEGEYGGGPVRIWDSGWYEALEWVEGKVTFRLHGRRHCGEYHLFRTGKDAGANQWLVIRADDPEPGELPPGPPEYAPMLACPWDAPFDDPDWLFEVKWDGVRVIATVERPGIADDGRTVLRSRLGNDVTVAYPELAALWERVVARNAVLDGEVVATDASGRPSFQLLQRRMHLREGPAIERARRQTPVTLMVFDLLAVDGEPLVDRPLSERLERLDEVFVPGRAAQRSQTFPGEGVALYEAATARGLEGIVGKRASSRYKPGKRSRDWRKIKIRRQADVVIGGWMPGEGGRAGRLGALLAGAYDDGRLRYVGRVGTGFDEATLQMLAERLAELATGGSPFSDAPRLPGAHWVRQDLVCRVEYAELTDDTRLRAPAYKGLRDDADPRDCLLSDIA